MSHHNIPEDEAPITEAPPSYEDSLKNSAINSAPAPPSRPQQNLNGPSQLHSASTNSRSDSSQAISWHSNSMPSSAGSVSLRPPEGYLSFQRPPQHPPLQQNPPKKNENISTDLYTNNSELPFQYSAGEFCKKCKNTGFKEKGKPCMTCWDKHHKTKRYNPNPEMGFDFPRGFICKKCANTGVKWKSGRGCSDCYSRYGPRNRIQSIPSGYGTQTIMAPPSNYPYTSSKWNAYNPVGPPVQVMPGDPRLGGILCSNCRGSGQTRFFLDTEICQMCGGLGRILARQFNPY